ncbi:hypothetical protein M9458_041260, partial [Cirrhinus mrigala]
GVPVGVYLSTSALPYGWMGPPLRWEKPSIQPHPTSITTSLIPVPSQPPPARTEIQPEPTADEELTLAVMREPEPERTQSVPEPQKESSQVCEPAPPCIALGSLVENEGMEKDPSHYPTAEDDLEWSFLECLEGITCVFIIGDPAQLTITCVFVIAGPAQVRESGDCRTPTPQPPSPASPSHPSSAGFLQSLDISSCPTQLCGSASGPLVSSSVQARASGPFTLPLSVDPPSPPWLFPPSAPPGTIILLPPSGSFVPTAPPWSVTVSDAWSLHLCGFTALFIPLHVVTAVLRLPVSTSFACCGIFAVVSCTVSATSALRLCPGPLFQWLHLCPSSPCMAAPSIHSAVGWALDPWLATPPNHSVLNLATIGFSLGPIFICSPWALPPSAPFC